MAQRTQSICYPQFVLFFSVLPSVAIISFMFLVSCLGIFCSQKVHRVHQWHIFEQIFPLYVSYNIYNNVTWSTPAQSLGLFLWFKMVVWVILGWIFYHSVFGGEVLDSYFKIHQLSLEE